VNRFLFLSIAAAGCTEQPTEPPPPTIEGVSQKITFDSVSSLGPHYSIGSIQRRNIRPGTDDFEQSESIEIAWNSWESFHFQRGVDGEPTFEAIVHEGTSSTRNGRGRWKTTSDGENARLDVYTAWNTWDEALAGFQGRIGFEPLGETIIDGRPAKRFSLVLLPKPATSKRRKKGHGMQPHRLEGEVAIDQATAVRLRATVHAVSKQGNLVRHTKFNIRRSGIGEIQSIEAPEAPVGSPGDLLRKLPTRPNSR
jgi:hypothetical protein